VANETDAPVSVPWSTALNGLSSVPENWTTYAGGFANWAALLTGRFERRAHAANDSAFRSNVSVPDNGK
jgi:hypothetical protein